jgi:hypothetical protein
LHGENEVFQRNRNDFPKVSFTLDVIWGHMGHYFVSWKWIKWFRFFGVFFTGAIDHAPQMFVQAFSGAVSWPWPSLQRCVVLLLRWLWTSRHLPKLTRCCFGYRKLDFMVCYGIKTPIHVLLVFEVHDLVWAWFKELNPRRRVYVQIPKPSMAQLKCNLSDTCGSPGGGGRSPNWRGSDHFFQNHWIFELNRQFFQTCNILSSHLNITKWNAINGKKLAGNL